MARASAWAALMAPVVSGPNMMFCRTVIQSNRAPAWKTTTRSAPGRGARPGAAMT